MLRVADVTAAMSVEALLGTDRAFAADLVALRPQPGQAASAANLRALLAGSEIVASHRHGDPRVQDAYSLRCAPQVDRRGPRHAGLRRAAWRTTSCARRSTTRWCCPTGASSRAATSTARRVAFACDFLAIAAAEVGRDRRAAHRPAAGCGALARAAAVPGRGPGRQLGDDARAGTRRPRWSPRTAGWRRRRASTRCRRARCRRTTCRWVGARRASCGDRSRTSAGSSRSSSPARRARSTCVRRCDPPPGPPRRIGRCARSCRTGPGPLPGAGARRGRGAGRAPGAAGGGRGGDRSAAMTVLPIATVGDPVLRLRAPELTVDELRSPELQNLIERSDRDQARRRRRGPGRHAGVSGEAGRSGRGGCKHPLRVQAADPADGDRQSGDRAAVRRRSSDEGFCRRPRSERRRAVLAVRGEHRRLSRRPRDASQIPRPMDRRHLPHELDHLDGVLFLDRVADPTTSALVEQSTAWTAAASYPCAGERSVNP